MSSEEKCQIKIAHTHNPDGKTVTFSIKRNPSICPEHNYRESLSEEEFWSYVFQNRYADWTGPEEPDDIDDESIEDRCLVCGSTGACMYDSEGRPLIHSVEEDDD